MVEPGQVSQTAGEQLSRVGSADILIGILAATRPEEVPAWVRAVETALEGLTTRVRTALVRPGAETVLAQAEQAATRDIVVLSHPLFDADSLVDPVQRYSRAYGSLFALSRSLEARACVIFAAELNDSSARWMHRLLRPVLELDFDLATPWYVRPKFEGLLNSSILSPLTRALYGKQMQSPFGPDCACSARLIATLQAANGSNGTLGAARSQVPLLAPAAACGDFEICQVYLGAQFRPAAEPVELSTLLAQALAPMFLDIGSKAAYWQKIRGSEPVPVFGAKEDSGGDAEDATGDDSVVDPTRMIESFHLGLKSLREVWAVALPPATLFELGKLARVSMDQFRFPDELWARVVYDFVLAHRLGAISREHLLRAMTPLYLAWVASYALEIKSAQLVEVERRLEDLSLAFEAAKPYFLSRWRWPDRFNP